MRDDIAELYRYKKLCGILIDALEQYADPDFYFAIAFAPDTPAGSFADDFSRVDGSQYNRVMPGKLARLTLKKAATKYGDLSVMK